MVKINIAAICLALLSRSPLAKMSQALPEAAFASYREGTLPA
jgi:hypothetical protein